MPRTTPHLLPKLSRLLAQVGTNLKQARLRRRYGAEIVAERSGISRKTLQRVERGDPAVALGIYARVLQALGLVDDLATLASDDELGRRLQDLNLPMRKRAPRKADTDEDSSAKR
jgi:transcriptional regulator with XRE-family HTH domain